MGPFLGIQFIMTVISTVILDIFIVYLPQDWNVYALAAFFWLGFIVPAQVSGVIFGGTEGKWVLHKIAIQAGAAFFCIEIAAAVLHFI
jgi:hypothetical protein